MISNGICHPFFVVFQQKVKIFTSQTQEVIIVLIDGCIRRALVVVIAMQAMTVKFVLHINIMEKSNKDIRLKKHPFRTP